MSEEIGAGIMIAAFFFSVAWVLIKWREFVVNYEIKKLELNAVQEKVKK